MKRALLFLLVTIVVAEAAFLLSPKIFSGREAAKGPASQEDTLDRYASEAVSLCSSAEYRPTCYEEEVPKLMDHLSLEQAFEVTRRIQEKDPTYRYCHVLGHKLSERETARDPDRWKEVITRCPSGLCSNGCIHGAFQERFRSESLSDEQIAQIEPDLKTVCEARGKWAPTGLEQASCYHAVGHLLMYITNGEIQKAVPLCQKVARQPDGRDFTQLCYDGTFMQIFQPLEPEDFALVKGKAPAKENLLSFCSGFSNEEKASCWNEGWPLYSQEIKTPEGLTAFCTKLDRPQDQRRCFMAMFYVLTAQFNLDEKKVTPLCSGLSTEWRGQCFANAASRMIETDYRNIDRAVQLCAEAARHGDASPCYRELAFFAHYNFHAGSEDFYRICRALPESWRDRCLNGTEPL